MTEIILDCGHAPTLNAGIGTGYGTWEATGERLCYACCDARELAHVLSPETTVFGGYVQHGRITTWTGGPLATVTDTATSRKRYSTYGLPLHLTSVYAVTPDGRRWYGRYQADNGDLVRLRLRKRS